MVEFLPHELYKTDIIKIVDFHWKNNLKYIIFYNLLYFFYGSLIVANLELDNHGFSTEQREIWIKVNIGYACFLLFLEVI